MLLRLFFFFYLINKLNLVIIILLPKGKTCVKNLETVSLNILLFGVVDSV